MEEIPLIWCISFNASCDCKEAITALILMIVGIMFIAGMIMETMPNVVLLTPMLLPIGINLGFDPIHFGIIMVANLAIGFVTPPLVSVILPLLVSIV